LSVKKEIGAAKTLLSKKKEPRRRGSRGLVNRQGSVTAAKAQLLLVRLPPALPACNPRQQRSGQNCSHCIILLNIMGSFAER
jgi:hypothetical protein